MADMKYTHLEEALRAYGQEVADRYKERLVAEGKNATSSLYQSVRPMLVSSESGYILYLALQDYWKYLERGTRLQGPYKQRGLFPPVEPFRRWIKAKGIVPYRGKDGRLPTPNQLAFLIARKVWRDGTKPYWFLRDSLSPEQEVAERMKEAVKADIEDWIQATIQEIR